MKDFIYISATILAGWVIARSSISVLTIFSLSGAVCGFALFFLMPICIHLKCVFLDRSSGRIRGDEEWNQSIRPNSCRCDNVYRSKATLYLETFVLCLILIVSFAAVLYTLIYIYETT